MHSLSTSFILGYHGCDAETAEKLLRNEPFQPSTNEYDWLGHGIYFWETNPDRAIDWARERAPATGAAPANQPAVVGAIVDLGFCLDLISSNGINTVEDIYSEYETVTTASGAKIARNSGGKDHTSRNLDCAIITYLHAVRERDNEPPFDTVRGVFLEGAPIFRNSGFRQKTHIQICVRNPATIKGVFRVPDDHFTGL